MKETLFKYFEKKQNFSKVIIIYDKIIVLSSMQALTSVEKIIRMDEASWVINIFQKWYDNL